MTTRYDYFDDPDYSLNLNTLISGMMVVVKMVGVVIPADVSGIAMLSW